MTALRFTPEIRKKLNQQLIVRAAITTALMGSVVVASEWRRHFWLALGLLLAWQVISNIAGKLIGGRPERSVPNLTFFVINTSVAMAFCVATSWSIAGLLIIPFLVATYEVFGDGDTRPFVVAQLAIFAFAMLLSGVSFGNAAAVTTCAWAIHWLSDGRSLTLRAALAELATANVSLANEMKARLLAEAELRQAQKLESVGRLAAGIAHEINTPVQYVKDSVQFLGETLDTVSSVLQAYRVGSNNVALKKVDDDADLEFLLENIPSAIARSNEGLQRISVIVRSMRDFAHPSQKEMCPFDLNRAIESTLAIAASEYRMVADVVTELGDLPLVECHGGEVNQVLLNLIVNAGHAIAERSDTSGQRGRITVRSQLNGPDVVISVSDTGVGIPEAIQQSIFDPFFTTKEVGKGTGQGLAIARSVVHKHGGSITFESKVGEGTTFFIRLPTRSLAVVAEAA